jgi:hypothetical protein
MVAHDGNSDLSIVFCTAVHDDTGEIQVTVSRSTPLCQSGQFQSMHANLTSCYPACLPACVCVPAGRSTLMCSGRCRSTQRQ